MSTKQSQQKIYFISGLPRSGSTLLANILAQNPDFYASATSGIADVMFGVRNQWDTLIEFRAQPNPEAKQRVLQSILPAYYADRPENVVFDKSRSWVSLLEMAEQVLKHEPKVLVPVRSIPDILSSFEKLWRKRSSLGQLGQEGKHYFQFQTVEGRCEVWMRPDEPVGLAYNRIRDAVVRGHMPNLFFVEFDSLTSQPEKTMKQVYEFLDEPYYKHNFDQVEQVTVEDDAVHGIEDLHTIRSKVEPLQSDWPEILGHAAKPYENLEFWHKLPQTEFGEKK